MTLSKLLLLRAVDSNGFIYTLFELAYINSHLNVSTFIDCKRLIHGLNQ